MLGVVGVTLLVFLSAVAAASATIASHRARAAADLGALAAASGLTQGMGPAAACTRASILVDRNSAVLTACEARADGSVLVSAVCPWSAPWPVRPPAHATARAGPAVSGQVSRGP